MAVSDEPSWPPDERPVPLSGHGRDGSSGGIADEAEVLVRAARDAIAREDTDPYVTIAQLGAAHGSEPEPQDRSHRSVTRVAIALACALAFAHGWATGESRVRATAGLCDSHHCHESTLSSALEKE